MLDPPAGLVFLRSGFASMIGTTGCRPLNDFAATTTRDFYQGSPPVVAEGLASDLAYTSRFLLTIFEESFGGDLRDLPFWWSGSVAIEALAEVWPVVEAGSAWPSPALSEGLRLSKVGGLPADQLEPLLALSRRLYYESSFDPEHPTLALIRCRQELEELSNGFKEVGDERAALATRAAAKALGERVQVGRSLAECWRHICDRNPELWRDSVER